MNLIVDAGNTQIKWAFFDAGHLTEKSDVKGWEEFALATWKEKLSGVQACMLSSTRKEWSGFEDVLISSGITSYKLSAGLPLPISLDYETPDTLGLDRIAGAAGAVACFPGCDVLIIDMGTAITYDLVTADGVFRGGNISPGMDIRFKSLNRFTDNLPQVEPDQEAPEMGKSTFRAIQAGVQTGILFELTAYINTLKNKYNGLRVILTGGGAEFFVKKLKKTIFVDPNLVLKGLNHILEYQNGEQSGR